MFHASRLSEGVYAFGFHNPEDDFTNAGYLYVLDIGRKDEALLVVGGGETAGGGLLILARLNPDGGVDSFLLGQSDEDKQKVLVSIATRHGIDAEVGEEVLGGQIRAADLRSTFLDPDFLSNVDLEYMFTIRRLENQIGWPDDLWMKAKPTLQLQGPATIIEDIGVPQEGRVALVIGNDAYDDLPRLQKAVADAESMAVLLREKGFNVIYRQNATRAQIDGAVAEFVSAVSPGDGILLLGSRLERRRPELSIGD